MKKKLKIVDPLYYICTETYYRKIKSADKKFRTYLKIYGDAWGLRGDITNIKGNVTGIYGDASGIIGDLDACEITDEERRNGINIENLCEKSAEEVDKQLHKN